MRKFPNPQKQGLTIRSIISEAEGNSVYSFPHIYISQKLLASLKLKWGQSIILSTGGPKNIKTCKAFVFGSQSLNEKQTKASSVVCKELEIREKDVLQIQGNNNRSPDTGKVKKRSSPQITLPLVEQIQMIGNQFFTFARNSQIQMIGKVVRNKLKIQVKQFREMKVYVQEFDDKVNEIKVEDIFRMLKDTKNFLYNNQKKAIIINKTLQLKLKKCQNSLRWIENEIMFDILNEMSKKIQKNDFKIQKQGTVTQSQTSESSHQPPESINLQKKSKTHKNKQNLLIEPLYDFQLTNQINKLQKHIKHLDYQMNQLKNKNNLHQFENVKQSNANMNSFVEQIQVMSNQIKQISNESYYCYALQKQQNQEIKLRMEKVQTELRQIRQKQRNMENQVSSQLKRHVDKTKTIIDKLDDKDLNFAFDSRNIKIDVEKDIIPITIQKIKIDFQSKYLSEFIIEGSKIIRMGSKGWTQLLCANIIPACTISRYQMKILQSKYNFIMFGLISKQCIQEKSSWTFDKCYAYFAWNGNAYIQGQCMVKQGRGFKVGEIIAMQVFLDEGLVRWKVNDQLVFETKRQNLKNLTRHWVPYVEMFSPGDSIKFVNNDFCEAI